MKKPIKNMSASVRTRLLNLARESGRNFQELTVRYTVERFIARLVASEYHEHFILKGAMLYIPWKLDDQRTTMDLDLLGFGSPDLDNLAQVFKRIFQTTIEDDGLIFDSESLKAAAIREDSVYDGVRIIARVSLGNMPIRLQVDVGFGDQVIPAPQSTEFPALLAEHGPVIRSYSPETVIAEKFNAMVVLGMANSRMKDYFDIWMLSRSFSFEADILSEAIQQTFSKRQTALPVSEPVGLRAEFGSDESKQRQWSGFIRKQRRQETAPELPDVVKWVRTFLMPIITDTATGSWNAEDGWQ
jgi:hypothetical protein